MADKRIEALLESVARDWDQHACGDDECPLAGVDCLIAYLTRRLLPLLEAGQVLYGNAPLWARNQYDAALKQASEERK